MKKKRSDADIVIREIDKRTQDVKKYEKKVNKELKELRKLQIFQPDFHPKEKNKMFRSKYLKYLKIKDKLKIILGEDNYFN